MAKTSTAAAGDQEEPQGIVDGVDVRSSFQSESDKVGRFNLAVFGNTGVGKSTLINAVFGDEIAETGIGRPVTTKRHFYFAESARLGLLDNRGLEIKDDPKALLREFSEYLDGRRDKPLDEQLHLIWYCVSARGGRLQEGEEEFIAGLRELNLPVIAVMTQAQVRDGELNPADEQLKAHIEGRNLGIFGNRCLPVLAADDEFNGYRTFGIPGLLAATYQAAPEGVAEAFVAAQRGGNP